MSEKNTHTDPEWLTKEYVEYKLCRYFEDDSLQLKKLETEPATSKGDNYASVMTRINLEYSTKDSKDTQSATFLLKTTFAAKDPAANILAGYGVSIREMDMYQQQPTWPEW